MAYETDQGTLQLIGQLTRPGARRLAAFLTRCDGLRAGDSIAIQTFTAVDFHGRDDIVDMKLERKVGPDAKILSTVRLRNGALWRRGQLRMPGVVLPDTIIMALKGRRIEEIVEGAPFTGFELTGGVQDGAGDTGSLRLRCTAERTGPIAVDVDAAPEVDLGVLQEMVAERMGRTPVEPFAAHVLDTLPREEALVTLMRLCEATPGKGDETVSLRYEDLLDGFVRPAHLKGVGKPNSDTSSNAYDYGAIRLRLVKAGVQAECHAGAQCLIEKGEVHYEHPEERLDTVREALGFHLPGVTLKAARIWTYGALRGHRLQPDSTISGTLCL